MENEIKTEDPLSQGPLTSSLHRQRFPLSSLEIVFGGLIILGLIYIGYILFFQDSSGSVSNLEKKIRNLETLSREQGEKLDKKIKEIQESQTRLEARLKALETDNQRKPAKVETKQAPKVVEKTPLPVSTEKKKIQHKVKKGETLQKIAAKYKVSPGDLLQWNKRNKNKPVRPGEILTILSR
ncbi:MAG: LysM peptidoglycan-binding domain-containing protein [Deltaproteobacteria bacterium]|nr:LysM peptidoglycan-binding domain-containing protein [Deltaproteobacteria bacterium]